MPQAAFIWLGIGIVAAVIEGLTTQLISIWFAVGAVAAALTALLGGGFGTQLLMFAMVSALLLVCTRPFLKNKFKVKKEPTNADQLIGRIAVVAVSTDPVMGTARVMVQGMEWAARTKDARLLEVGERVEILTIEGVTLIVSPRAAQ